MIRKQNNFFQHPLAPRRFRFAAPVLSFAFCVLFLLTPAFAQYRLDLPDKGTPTAPPPPVIVEKANAQLPLDLKFTSSDGTTAPLSTWFNHGRPVVLSLVYFSCPNLCNFNQDSLCGIVREGPRELKLGQDYDILVVSIDPDDTSAEAAAKRKNYLAKIPLPESQSGFTYLTGSQENVKALADAVGFGYRINPVNSPSRNGKIAHATGIFVCTPVGHLSQTILGISYMPDQLHNALRVASNGQIGSGLLSFALSCGACYFDPKSGMYKQNPWFYAGTVGGLMSLIFVITFLSILFHGDAKRNKNPPAPTPPEST